MKYFLAAILLAVSILAFSQFNKGDKVLGGTLSFNTTKNENSRYVNLSTNSTYFSIYPSFGVLINSNLEIGALLGYTSSHDEWKATDSSTDRKSNNLATGIYLQRYFVISDKFLFSVIANINYAGGKEKTLITSQNDFDENESKQNSFRIIFRPNFIFFPSPHWGLQASIGDLSFTRTHFKNKMNDNTSNQFGVNYGSVSFGIAYYFRRDLE
jgi:hypothetical protein